jgi:hypothetical protein
MSIERLNNLPEDRGRTFNYGRYLAKIHCGTVACAAGELALYPPFMAMGLSIDAFGDISYTNVNITYASNILNLSKFLGITYEESKAAFTSLDDILEIEAYKITAKHVADYLQKLLDEELAETQEEVEVA